MATLSLTNIAAITESLASGRNSDKFDISAELVSQCDVNGIDQALCIKDKTGYAIIDQLPRGNTPADLQPGDLLRIRGFISRLNFGIRKICSDKITRQGRRPPQLPIPITAKEYLTGKFDSQFISMTGILRDAVKDEIDTRVMRLSMLSDGNTIFAFVTCANNDISKYQRLINSKIKITGICRHRCYSLRRMQGRIISILSVTPLSPQDDPFDGTELDAAMLLSPADILRLGRCHAIGRVLATWQGSKILIKTAQGAFSTVQTADTGTLPPCGAQIEVTGYASTDLYNINLSGAIWRQIGDASPPNTPPTSITTRQLYRNASDIPRLDISFHGNPISLQGIVQSIPPDGDPRTPFLLDDRGFVMPVDVSEHPEVLGKLSVGSKVRVSGICVTDTEEWHPHAGFPRTRGFTLVLRTPDDITIIARPPFWNRQRLLAAVSTLFALLLGCVFWNRSLRLMVERKSKRLIKEEIAHAKADFRVEERTQLAANLHDSFRKCSPD